MRRLQPINDLVERIAALESALRTGTPPAQSNTPTGTAGTPPRSSSGSSRAASSSSARSASVSDDNVKQAAAVTEPIETPVQSPPADGNGNYSSSAIDEKPVGESSDIERLKNALEKRRKKFLVIALEGARVARIEGDELYVEFAPEDKHLRDTLAKGEDVKVIREACLEVIGRELGVRIAVKDVIANESMPLSQEEEEQREKQSLRATAEQHPLVQEVLRKFRGEIIDVQRL
jgi:hypothetical protein